MSEEYLVERIKKGDITITNISKNDFKSLLLNKETQKYGLILCGQAYYIKATETLNIRMNEICLNDEYNKGIISDYYDMVRLGNDGKIYISAPACAYKYGQYFTHLFNSMIDIDTGNPNILKMLVNFLNVFKDIKENNLYNKIIEQCDKIKDKYINSPSNSKYNITSAIQNGLNELNDGFKSGEMVEYLDGCDNVEELFELSVSTIGSLDSLLSEFEEDIAELKKLLEKRKKYK